MEAFLVTLVLVAVLAFEAGSKHVKSPTRPADQTGSQQERAVKDKPSVSVCTPDHHPFIQRDLTMPIRNSVDEDGR